MQPYQFKINKCKKQKNPKPTDKGREEELFILKRQSFGENLLPVVTPLPTYAECQTAKLNLECTGERSSTAKSNAAHSLKILLIIHNYSLLLKCEPLRLISPAILNQGVQSGLNKQRN